MYSKKSIIQLHADICTVYAFDVYVVLFLCFNICSIKQLSLDINTTTKHNNIKQEKDEEGTRKTKVYCSK